MMRLAVKTGNLRKLKIFSSRYIIFPKNIIILKQDYVNNLFNLLNTKSIKVVPIFFE